MRNVFSLFVFAVALLFATVTVNAADAPFKHNVWSEPQTSQLIARDPTWAFTFVCLAEGELFKAEQRGDHNAALTQADDLARWVIQAMKVRKGWMGGCTYEPAVQKYLFEYGNVPKRGRVQIQSGALWDAGEFLYALYLQYPELPGRQGVDFRGPLPTVEKVREIALSGCDQGFPPSFIATGLRCPPATRAGRKK